MENPKTTQYVNQLMKDGYILVGSRAFFSGIPGFNPHDYDFVKFVNPNKEFKFLKHEHINGVCVNQIVKMPIEQLMNYVDNMKSPFITGFYLVPEAAESYGIDWNRDRHLFENHNKLFKGKHEYIRAIYDMYVQNGKMELTKEQLNYAYRLYRNFR